MLRVGSGQGLAAVDGGDVVGQRDTVSVRRQFRSRQIACRSLARADACAS